MSYRVLYSFDYLKMDTLIAKVQVCSDGVRAINYTDDLMDSPFSLRTFVSHDDLEEFYAERTFPKERHNVKAILKGKPYGYDRLAIIHDTHGIMSHDLFWIRFEGEYLCWDDVKEWLEHKNVWYRVYEV